MGQNKHYCIVLCCVVMIKGEHWDISLLYESNMLVNIYHGIIHNLHDKGCTFQCTQLEKGISLQEF